MGCSIFFFVVGLELKREFVAGDRSPIRVAVPPMLEAITSAMRYGAARSPSRSHTRNVTGARSRRVVTLSSNADAPAVITHSITIRRYGLPPALLADHTATYSKTPVRRSTETIIIMPSSKKMTFHSIQVRESKNAWSASEMCNSSISPAPQRATLVRWTHSVATGRGRRRR